MKDASSVDTIDRVGPGFSAAGDNSWRDDGYDKDEDEFFENPRVNRLIFWIILVILVVSAYMIASGRA